MKVTIYAQPYVGVYGKINVPEDIKKEDIERYVEDNFGDVMWDYEGANYDFSGVDLDIIGRREA